MQGSSAAKHALGLPQILWLVLEHLRPLSYAQGEHVNNMISEHDDEDDEESSSADYAKKAALSTALSTLWAAALVNCAWFATAHAPTQATSRLLAEPASEDTGAPPCVARRRVVICASS
jgi:hypothetical protein